MLSLTITPRELERQAQLAFENKLCRVFLCSDPAYELASTDTIATFENYRIPESGGYQDFTEAIREGAYSDARQRYEMPQINATFGAIEEGFFFDLIVVQIDSAEYPHSVIRLQSG